MSFKETALAKLREINKNFSFSDYSYQEQTSDPDEWWYRGHGDCVEAIESIPEDSAWIPVSEQLPDNGEYLVFYGNRQISIAFADDGFKSGWTWNHADSFTPPIYWQPLPKPPVTE